MRYHRAQNGLDGRPFEVGQHRIGGGPVPVANDENRRKLVREARLLGLAAALSRRPPDELARALDRPQEESLVGLDDALDRLWLGVLLLLQEAVAPTERGGEIDVAAGGRLP